MIVIMLIVDVTTRKHWIVSVVVLSLREEGW